MKMRKIVSIVIASLISMSSLGINAMAADANIDANETKSKVETEAIIWGDANCDGAVTLNDAVAILQLVALPGKYGVGKEKGITEKGYLQADVFQNGDGVNGMDALSVMKRDAKVINSLPESYLVPPTTTTVTTKPATTTTTQTAATTAKTTTTKATSTATKATSTATKATSTATKTTSTATKATSTATKATSTTTKVTTTFTVTTTIVTTTSPNSWTPPAREELVNELGETISEDKYNILLATAQLWGIDRYKIKWDNHPITYAYADPGLYYCLYNQITYGYGVQIVPSVDETGEGNIEKVAPSKLDKYYYTTFSNFCYRPITEYDNFEENPPAGAARPSDGMILTYMLDYFEPKSLTVGSTYQEAVEEWNLVNEFEIANNWYLIPVDEDGNEIYELNSRENLDLSTKPGATSKYWFTADELSPRGSCVERKVLMPLINTAEQLGMPNFRLEYCKEEPTMFCFSSTCEPDMPKYCPVQMVSNEELCNNLTDEEISLVEEQLNLEQYEEEEYRKLRDNPMYPYFFCTARENYPECKLGTEKLALDTPKHNFYGVVVMIPLDEEGNDDLRFWWY